MTIDETIERFRSGLGIKQSRRTVMTYTTALNHFREFLSTEANLAPETSPAESLTVDHALNYVKWLYEVHFSDSEMPKSTLATYLASMTRYYNFIQHEGIIHLGDEERQRMIDAFKGYRKGTTRPLPKFPGDDTVEKMVKAARSVPSQRDNPRQDLCRLRNIAVLETLRTTGVRVGELVALRRGDLDYSTKTAYVKGRNNQERQVHFDELAWHALNTYLKTRADGAGQKALYTLPVFARHDRAAGSKILPVSTNTIRRIFYACAKRACIDTPITPHALRHAFAKRVLDSTGDLATTQNLLGHASATTTRIYTKVTQPEE